MNYHELEAQATPGPLVATRPTGCGDTLINSEATIQSTQVAYVYGKADEQPINACLLAHCRNHFGRLLEALKKHQNTISAHSGIPGEGMRIATIIKRCETVEEA
jgi:hypothetical protein